MQKDSWQSSGEEAKESGGYPKSRALQSPHNRGNSLSHKAVESHVGWGKNKVELGVGSG